MRISLPSLGAIVRAALHTLRRFPLVLLAGALSALAAILMVDDVGPEWLHDRLLAAASLGLPLFTALTLLAERIKRGPAATLALALAGAAALAGVFAAWPHWSEPVRAGRYAQLSVAFHLLVAFVAFLGRPLLNAFWQFNRALLERLVIAAATSATLFLGLALALAAVDKLFGVDVPDTGYGRLWFLTAFVFNTWFFLGGVPDDLTALEERRDYPVVIRVFAQYTLVPLVSVYLVILTLYLGKVVVTWDWPSGWIGNLVSGVAAAGILALLLVHPVAEQPEQRWVATFARAFWLATMPAIVMLWLALYQRIHQYGVTERRYFLVILSVWLAALAVYYTATRSRNIRFIPVSLCVGALLTFAGPWGAYAVSEASQARRLEGLLTRRGVLVERRIRRVTGEVPPEQRREISAIVRYLVETHGTASLAPWFDESLARRAGLDRPRIARPTRAAVDERSRAIVEAFGVPYLARWESEQDVRRYTYDATGGGAVRIQGYDLLVRITGGGDIASVAGEELAAVVIPSPAIIRLVRGGEALLDVELEPVVARARALGQRRRYARVPRDSLRVEAENARARALVWLRSLVVADSAGALSVPSAAGDVLVQLRR